MAEMRKFGPMKIAKTERTCMVDDRQKECRKPDGAVYKKEKI